MALATGPLTPRWLACWLVNSWMAALYKRCSIAHMAPAYGSNHRFTGQCNDAFFQLAKQVAPAVSYVRNITPSIHHYQYTFKVDFI